MNYNWNWGIFFEASPEGTGTYLDMLLLGLRWTLVTALCAVWLLSSGRPPKHHGPFDLNQFARIPLSHEGRVMPLDTLARVSLRVMSGKSELRTDHGKLPAIRWLAQLATG